MSCSSGWCLNRCAKGISLFAPDRLHGVHPIPPENLPACSGETRSVLFMPAPNQRRGASVTLCTASAAPHSTGGSLNQCTPLRREIAARRAPRPQSLFRALQRAPARFPAGPGARSIPAEARPNLDHAAGPVWFLSNATHNAHEHTRGVGHSQGEAITAGDEAIHEAMRAFARGARSAEPPRSRKRILK